MPAAAHCTACCTAWTASNAAQLSGPPPKDASWQQVAAHATLLNATAQAPERSAAQKASSAPPGFSSRKWISAELAAMGRGEVGRLNGCSMCTRECSSVGDALAASRQAQRGFSLDRRAGSKRRITQVSPGSEPPGCSSLLNRLASCCGSADTESTMNTGWAARGAGATAVPKSSWAKGWEEEEERAASAQLHTSGSGLQAPLCCTHARRPVQKAM